MCGTRESPEWRRNETGIKDLCNAYVFFGCSGVAVEGGNEVWTTRCIGGNCGYVARASQAVYASIAAIRGSRDALPAARWHENVIRLISGSRRQNTGSKDGTSPGSRERGRARTYAGVPTAMKKDASGRQTQPSQPWDP